ncbi:hypothetical protein [Streptomyces achromogenes]|uniref:hypothetical protein n=1 Tax=Streptomyces achromogenes TaxID=67255 RepID=UPI0036CD2F7F
MTQPDPQPYRYVDSDGFCLSARLLPDLNTGGLTETLSITIEGSDEPQSIHVQASDAPTVTAGILRAAGQRAAEAAVVSPPAVQALIARAAEAAMALADAEQMQAQAEALLEAADLLQAWRPEGFERWAVAEQDRYEDGINDATNHLRRLAGAQPQPDCGATQRPAGLTVPALARLLAGAAALTGDAPPYDRLPAADRERYLGQAWQLMSRATGEPKS